MDNTVSDVTATGGTEETRAEAMQSPATVVTSWLESIDLADKEEEHWRKKAQICLNIYAMEKKEGEQVKYNILSTNTDTILPSLYNSVPLADVRRRWSDDDPTGKQAAQITERAISFSVDDTSFDQNLKSAVFDMALPGRGVARIQYNPVVKDDAQFGAQIVYQQLYLQHTQWDDFRHGPAKKWDDVPWVAFRHRMTRDQLRLLNPDCADGVKMDCEVNGYDKDKSKAPPDLFKRAYVWEIWDKEGGQVLFVAPSYKNQPIKVMPPPFKVKGFFPCPEPLRSIYRSDSLVPIEPYRIYQQQAEELDALTKRLTALLKVLKFRGVRATALGDAFEKMKDLADGEFASVDNIFEMMVAQGGLDNAIWVMPIDKLIGVITSVSEERERVKQVIYELSGIADIMRGASKPQETLGAQEIKTQWGTLRLQDRQKAVQNFARDLFRIMAEIIAENFTPEVLTMMTGIPVTPEVMRLLKTDILRQYRVDVETDSTIRADLNRSQSNMAQFVQGFGQFVQSIGPAVQSGFMPLPVAVEMVTSFARVFKLGRQVEDALDGLKQQAEQQQTAPPGQPLMQSPMMGHNGGPPMQPPVGHA